MVVEVVARQQPKTTEVQSLLCQTDAEDLVKIHEQDKALKEFKS